MNNQVTSFWNRTKSSVENYRYPNYHGDMGPVGPGERANWEAAWNFAPGAQQLSQATSGSDPTVASRQ